MALKRYRQIFEALENERRVELYEFLLLKTFVSKSELAKKFDLKRASLNHHLNIMLKAGLVRERALILDGRRQFFIIPAVILHVDQLVEPKEEYQLLTDLLDPWTTRNLTLDTWGTLREELYRQDIPRPIIEAVETCLFPTVGKTASASSNYCIICRSPGARVFCHTCKHPICHVHTHQIKRDEHETGDETITLCPNCVEKFFG